MEFREIAAGLAVPEGSVALPDGGVLVVEVLGGRLTRVRPDGVKEVVAETGGGPNGAAIGPDGRCYVCNNGGIPLIELDGRLQPDPDPAAWAAGAIQRVDLTTGAVETLYAGGDHGFSAPNDLVFDAHGGFWFTDHGKTWERVRERGGLYYAKADGSSLELAVPGVESPNGVGLSPDGRTLYVAETFTGHLLSFEVIAPGKLRQPATDGFFSPPGAVLARAGPGQFFDSLAVDSGGCICVGTLGKGGVLVVAPDGGAQHIPFPDALVTNICFGGPELRTAYITLSHSGRLIAVPWPRPGLPLNGAAVKI